MKKIYVLIIFFSLVQTAFAKKVDEKTVLTSNKVNREDKNIIKAVGDVEIKKGSRILNANEVEYNQSTKKIKANSAVKVYDEKAEALFYSKQAEMSDDFLNADFFDSLLIFKNGANIKSGHLQRANENELTLEKGTFAVCPTNLYNINLNYDEVMKDFNNQKTPLFSLRSSRTDINLLNKKTLKLKSTSVWFWKIPIFYMPYLKISEIDINGFEMPGIEHTTHYGYGVYVPYKIVGNNYKLKLTPKIYQKGNYLLNTKFNIGSGDKYKFIFNGDIANDNGKSKNIINSYGQTELEEGNYKQWRGFASLNGVYNFNLLWDFTVDAGIANDRYYLRDYHDDNLSYIKSDFSFSRVDLKDNTDYNYFQFSNIFFQELLEDDSSYNAPRYAPITKLNLQDTILRNDVNNLYYKAYFNTTSLFRTKGVEYNRFSITPSLNDSFNSKFGNINTSFEIKGDLYAMNEVGTHPKRYHGSESRVLPQVNLEWKKNFAFSMFSIQPITKYSGSPHTDNFEDNIPNEDSVPQAISFENIFSNNRFIGYDRQEYGNRITYGFEGTLLSDIGFGLAQGYRDDIKEDGNTLIGFEKNTSDYVGYLSYIINNNFDVYYRFMSDRESYIFKKNEVNLNFNVNNFGAYLIYLEMDKNALYTSDQEQLNGGIYFKIFRRWKISTSATVDLKHNSRFLENKAALRYDGDCTFWEIDYKTENPMTETKRSTTIDFIFGIKFNGF